MPNPAIRDQLNALKCDAPDLEDETKHYKICQECGQAVDLRRLGDMQHHLTDGHERLRTQ